MSAVGATRTRWTVWPLMSMPRMARAFSTASSGFSASLTPPALPRPPVFTCALTTTRPPFCSAAAAASSAFSTTVPRVTGTSCLAKSSFAWYSIRSTGTTVLFRGLHGLRARSARGGSRLTLAPWAGSRHRGFRTLRHMPDTAIERRVRSATVTLVVREHSPAGPGRPTVVLVHGYPDQQDTWDRLVARLPLDAWHVVTYDVRGAGSSDAPRRTADYRTERLVDDLVAVLDAVLPDGERAHLVGHD